MIVKMKKTNEKAVMPRKSHDNDAGFDFTAIEETIDVPNRTLTYNLGWAIEIPNGHVGFLFPRSSIANKDISLANSVGVIDAGYRGELVAKFKNTIPTRARKYDVGERVVQLIIMPIPTIELQVVDELADSVRGEGGWGSTGS